MAVVAYARVSTSKQETAAQVEALLKAGAERVYEEKISGAKRENRPELKKMMQNLRAGDLVLFTAMDRLARSSLDFQNIIHEITELGAKFKSLTEPMLDNTTPQGEMLTGILAVFAQFERRIIRERTEAGKARARLYGTKSGRDFGRPRKMTQVQRVEALKRLAAGETLEAVARTYSVHFTSISRLKTQKLSLEQAIAAHSGNGESFRRGH